jgi:hypothetical protein
LFAYTLRVGEAPLQSTARKVVVVDEKEMEAIEDE